MVVPIISTSLTVFPAAAIVTAGVIGALGVRLTRRTHDVFVRRPERQPLALSATPADTAFSADGDGAAATGQAGESRGKDAAVQLLDTWCDCPRSAWHALGARALQVTRSEACARAASQVILEGLLARHVNPMDAWLVRDFADTAWFSAPEDGAPSSSAVEMAARRAVTNGAFALLARAWLPVEHFERLALMVVR
jgi:hypothetical protein